MLSDPSFPPLLLMMLHAFNNFFCFVTGGFIISVTDTEVISCDYLLHVFSRKLYLRFLGVLSWNCLYIHSLLAGQVLTSIV